MPQHPARSASALAANSRTQVMAPVCAAGVPQSEAVRDLENNMAHIGVSQLTLERDIAAIGGKFIPSASQGKTLASLNDHAGVIVFPAKNKNIKIAEMLAVVKDTVTSPEGVKQERYFVKGYGNRLVPLSVVTGFQAEDYEHPPAAAADAAGGTPAPRPTEMETSFRTHLRKHSETATLYARSRADQSDRPVMKVPPNPLPMPRQSTWAMGEQSLHGFGEKPDVTAPPTPGATPGAAPTPRKSDFHRGYVDYNGVENRLIFFLNKDEVHARRRPQQTRPPHPADSNGKNKIEVPASVNMDGPILAQIQGIKRIETIGPAGVVEGVKLASFRVHFEKDQNKVLRITTEDDAVHELTFTPKGATLKRIHPAPSGDDPMAPLENADISLYFYQGANTGPHGSLQGYADPELVMSTGEVLPAGTLVSDPTGTGMLKAATKAFLELVTLSPSFGNHDGWSGATVNTGLQATMTAASVYLANALLDKVKAHTGGTLVPGADVFSASGAGHVTPLTLAGAVAPIVVVQKALTYGVAFILDKLPQSAKSRETGVGQFVNELLLPWVEETVRLMINYGLEKRLHLPRGTTTELAVLLLTSALTVSVRAARNRMGNAENHPWLEAAGQLTEFLAADLVGRSTGAVVGTEHWKEDPSNFGRNFGEAYITRAIARGYDKAGAPMLRTMLNALGWAGTNANAYDAQLNQQARFSPAGALRSWSHDITKALDVFGETVADKLQDIEATANAVHLVKKAAHRLHQLTDTIVLQAEQADADDEHWVQKAIAYQNTTDPAARKAILKEFEEEIARRVKLSEDTAGTATEIADTIRAITNHTQNLPENMRDGFEQITARYLELIKANPETNPGLYPVKPASDFLSAPLPAGSEPSTRLGGHTERIVNDLSTFTREPAKFIKTIHDAMVTLNGLPGSPAHSLPNTSGDNPADYRQLTPAILREQWDALVSYTVQSSPFHYKLRWGETGQNHFQMLADGIPIRTTAMNERGNVTGDRGRQVTGRMALLVNHAVLHGTPHPTPVVRAVVTEAFYQHPDSPPPPHSSDKVVTIGDQVSLTEIFSATSSSLLAASFLAPQGFNAADGARRARIVIDNGDHQPVAVSISRETDLKQAESLLMPGTSFIVSNIVREPAAPGTDAQKPGENLGQVIHFKRVNLWKAEALQRNYDALSAVQKAEGLTQGEDGKYSFDHSGVVLKDGTLTMDKDSGAFSRFNGTTGKLEPHQAKNYFLGTGMDDPGQKSRTRFPFTSDKSPRGLKDEINAMLLLGDSAVPYLDDMTKNASYEVDKRADGYYTRGTPANRFKQEDDQQRDLVRANARQVAERIDELEMNTAMPVVQGQSFQGQLLAETTASALRQPLKMVRIDGDGKVLTQDVPGGTDGAPPKTEPQILANIAEGFDGVDLRWEKQGHALIGVGPKGYYHMRYKDGELTAIPIEIGAGGHTPGNLLHAIAAAALPNPADSRYQVHDGRLKTTHQVQLASEQAIPGYYPQPADQDQDPVHHSAGQLLQRLKTYVGAEYEPMQAWLSARV
ncbi:hypothetical protein ACEN8M_13445 [Duganella sp. CT11-72]|uniref:hypothetical protein n=1 Tax=Duganella sp. CT11-72 TaxID=3243052 RepID=UPI0039B0D351